MWSLKACALAGCLVLLLQGARAEPCTPGADALGVARTVEIDPSAGPRFGFQYSEESFLAEGEVVLTFDDGPLRTYTKPVLEALSAHCTQATFFPVGRMALADPEMVKEYARRGHTVGSHTWSHQKLSALTPLKARTEIELGFSAVQLAMGSPIAPFFRFPYLSDSRSMLTHLQGRQISAFSIDVDSKDFRTRDPGTVRRRVMADLARHHRGILLFHDIQPSTARALPLILSDLKAKGYRIVHLVAKAPITTLGEFDAIAQREFEKRHKQATVQSIGEQAHPGPSLPSPPMQSAAVKHAGPQSPPAAEPSPRSSLRPASRAHTDDGWTTSIWR